MLSSIFVASFLLYVIQQKLVSNQSTKIVFVLIVGLMSGAGCMQYIKKKHGRTLKEVLTKHMSYHTNIIKDTVENENFKH